MSRVMQAWEQVLREAISQDYDEQQFALFQIGVVLQRHNPNITPESDMDEEALSRDLLRLALNEQRQSDTVVYLADLVQRFPNHADLFLYAISQAQPHLMIDKLLTLISQSGKKWKDNSVIQALFALTQAWRDGDDALRQTMLDSNIMPILESWETRSDDLVADKATTLINRMTDTLPDDSDTE